MNIKTNLIEEYISFVDLTRNKEILLKFYNFICGYFMFVFFVLFNYLNE